MKKNSRIAGMLCVNALIVIFEVIGLVLSFVEHGVGNFRFYTQDSNYLAMAASLFACVYAVRELCGKGSAPEWLHSFRCTSVSCLMVTFFVVLFVLMPMMGDNALVMLYGGSMLYHHTLCPILSALSFFVFESRDILPKTEIIKAMVPTLVYALAAIILNVCRVMEGPYPFLMVYSQPWYASVIWCAIILGIAGLLACAVLSAHNLICRRKMK